MSTRHKKSFLFVLCVSLGLSLQASVIVNLTEVGTCGSSTDLVWSNLTGTVSIESTQSDVNPTIDAVNNAFTQTDGVSGSIRVNVTAYDALSAPVFDPDLWIGGGQSAGCAITHMGANGWGVRADNQTNQLIQNDEYLILTVDLSGLVLGPNQVVTLSGVTFMSGRLGNIWQRDFGVTAGTSGAGVTVATNTENFVGSVVLSDGVQFAIDNVNNTALKSLEIDIVDFPGEHSAALCISNSNEFIVVSSTNLLPETRYMLQFKSDLNSAAWSNLPSVVGMSSGEWTVASTAKGFFRLLCGKKSAEEVWYELSVQDPDSPVDAFNFVANNPALPNVLLYGDSVSIGYTLAVRSALAGQANVYRLYRNSGASDYIVEYMEILRTTMGNSSVIDDEWDFDWDVIHFNVGLHDIKEVDGIVANNVAAYTNNLQAAVDYFKTTYPSAQLIWATTTPVPYGAITRDPANVEIYNTAAAEIMSGEMVMTNDLYSFTLPNHEEWCLAWPINVHYNESGQAAQGGRVAEVIHDALGL